MARTAKLFWSGRSQAVRLPKDFRMEGDEVRIRKQGAAVILEPMASDWAWLDGIAGKFSEDFFVEGRRQPRLPRSSEVDGMFD
ncbi:MAG: type II toxin-antitoxin system VapB family antitoxin [Gammaproteobacteria bacterium]|nr:type II toxin-antitoxin system VapB family antitoxin [Gammaproteobacteria bacterium]MDE0190877.1 type II toxin-antitoxin system VapB family antitoxin [Gammaproteobacteria bacterium]